MLVSSEYNFIKYPAKLFNYPSYYSLAASFSLNIKDIRNVL
jgi:hypothetical protein